MFIRRLSSGNANCPFPLEELRKRYNERSPQARQENTSEQGNLFQRVHSPVVSFAEVPSGLEHWSQNLQISHCGIVQLYRSYPIETSSQSDVVDTKLKTCSYKVLEERGYYFCTCMGRFDQ